MRIGVDLGGTKIEAICLDDASQVRARERIATPREDYPGTVSAVRDLVTRVESEVGETCSVGVGIPGTLSPATGLVKNANSTWLIGKPLDKDLRDALARPVRLANDADCFAMSEAADGAAAGTKSCFGVILGTGVGGGLVFGGNLIGGPNAIAGEWGHNALPWPTRDELPGPDCYCGLSGCIETWLSGPGFLSQAVAAGLTASSATEIETLAIDGNAQARTLLDHYQNRLARALAGVINIVDPETIVLGGGLSNLTSLYDAVPRLWNTHIFSDTVATKLVRNSHGDSSGVRGAAWLWPKEAP